jgi:UDP-N-acetyl-D-mannosaminuronate dehydrogenase
MPTAEIISLIGVGRLGIGSALAFEKAGYSVLGGDPNEDYVKSIDERRFVSNEPQATELLPA